MTPTPRPPPWENSFGEDPSMRHPPIAVALLVALAGAARGETPLPDDALKEIKAATAFIKFESQEFSKSGSGFVVRVDGGSAYLVTNQHVIAPTLTSEVPFTVRRGGRV